MEKKSCIDPLLSRSTPLIPIAPRFPRAEPSVLILRVPSRGGLHFPNLFTFLEGFNLLPVYPWGLGEEEILRREAIYMFDDDIDSPKSNLE